MTVILFIIILAVLILVHECGHFLVAKKSGIKVEEFGLGLPPRAWGKKIGETIYSLNWLPIGGFVKIFGEDPVDEAEGSEQSEGQKVDLTRAMFNKPRWVQALVLVAGITFNIIFAWILISIGFMIGLPAPANQSVFGRTQNLQVVITDILTSSPAEKAGLNSGDTILSVQVDGKEISDPTSENISNAITQSAKGDVVISYKRGQENPKTVVISPSSDIVKGERVIGISMETIGTLKLSPVLAFLEGAHSTYLLVIGTATGLINFIYKSLIFKSDLSQVTGPVGIAGVVGQARALGFVYVLSLTALISINLALINLIPFPALDGGRLLFVGIEAIIRRPIHPKVVRWTNSVGFALLLLLMLVITTHDIIKLF